MPVGEGTWSYKTGSPTTDPGPGRVQMDNIETPTVLAVSVLDANGIDRSDGLAQLVAGATLRIRREAAASQHLDAEVSLAPVDNTTWYSIPVTSGVSTLGTLTPNTALTLVAYQPDEPVGPGAVFDYFSEDEFREVAQDDAAPSTFDTDEIQRGHDEVVKRLELWARSSWVTRVWNIYRLVGHSYINLSRTPVLAINSFALAGEAVTEADYLLDLEGGRLMWGDWAGGVPILDGGPYLAEVEWTYGFASGDPAEIPWEIKRPVIMATSSLLRPQKQKSKVPPNTRGFSTGRTSFDFRFERAQTKPWPWDEAMSSQIRAAWDPFRSRQYMS